MRTPAAAVAGLSIIGLIHLSDAGAAEDSDAAPAAGGVEQPHLEEIVVTATKRTVGLQDVGVAVSALSSSAIEKAGFVGMGDYLTKLPSVTIQDRGPGRNQVVIRGVASSAGGAADNTVGIYIADVPLSPGLAFGNNGYPDLKLYDVQRVEVLRGPQGTLYGAGSLGGAVKIIPNDPVLNEKEAKADVTTSSTDHGAHNYDVSAAINLPLIDDEFALRVAGYYYDRDGFIDDRSAGLDYSQPLAALGGLSMNDAGVPDPGVGPRSANDVNSVVTQGVRASLRFSPMQALDVVASYLHQSADADGLPEVDLQSGPFQQSRLIEERLGDELDLASLHIGYDFGGGEVTSTTGYMNRRIFQNRDVSPGFFTAPINLLDANRTELWNEEVRFTSKDDQRFRWLGGVFYQRIRGHGRQNADWFGNAASMSAFFENLVFGAPLGITSNDEIFIRNDRATETQSALFGELSFDLTDTLRVVGGGRWFDYEQRTSGFQDGLFTAGTPVGGSPTVTGDLRNEESGFNPKGAVELRPAKGQLYYAQASKGFRLGGPQSGVPDAAPGCAADLTNIGLQPADTRKAISSDSLWSYELGAKTAFAEDRMTLNGAVYYIDWKDIPVGFLLPCGYSFGANAGKASSRGAELELQVLLTRDLTLSVGGSYTKAILEQDTPAETGLGGVKGDRLPGIPEWNAQAGLQYDFRVSQHPAFGRVDFSYVSGFLNKFPGDTGVIGESGNYALLNLRFGASLTDSLAAEIYAENLTDETVNLILDTEFADGRATIGRPRTVGVALRMRY